MATACDRNCGNCVHFYAVNECLGRCTGDLLKSAGYRDRRDDAKDCATYKSAYKELKAEFVALRAEYVTGSAMPFFVQARLADGTRIEVGRERVMQARCAGWRKEDNWYDDCGIRYRREMWLGGRLPIVLKIDIRNREWHG